MRFRSDEEYALHIDLREKLFGWRRRCGRFKSVTREYR
jgi:hypothetical protein